MQYFCRSFTRSSVLFTVVYHMIRHIYILSHFQAVLVLVQPFALALAFVLLLFSPISPRAQQDDPGLRTFYMGLMK